MFVFVAVACVLVKPFEPTHEYEGEQLADLEFTSSVAVKSTFSPEQIAFGFAVAVTEAIVVEAPKLMLISPSFEAVVQLLVPPFVILILNHEPAPNFAMSFKLPPVPTWKAPIFCVYVPVIPA